jgi:hypothetical protein
LNGFQGHLLGWQWCFKIWRSIACGLNRRDQCSGDNAEDPLDELDLTDNIPLGKPSDLIPKLKMDRLILEAALIRFGHALGEVTAKVAEIKRMLGYTQMKCQDARDQLICAIVTIGLYT